MSVHSQAQDYRKSSHIAFRDQSQAQLDAGTELDPQTQSQLSGYQLVDDPLHPHGKLVPKPDAGFFGTLGKKFLLPVAGAAGGILAAPYIAGAFGAGGGAGSGAGTAAADSGSYWADLGTAAPTAGGHTAGGLMAGGAGRFFNSNAGLGLVGQGVGALTNFFSQRSANNANMHAADLESQAAAASLAFLKQQEAERQREWQLTQDKNYQLYQEQQARLAPYRQLGAGSIGQMMHAPMTLNPQSNSIGSMMGGR